MIVARLFGFLVIITLGACLALFLATHDRRYLKYARSIFRFAIVVASVFAILFLLERLVPVI